MYTRTVFPFAVYTLNLKVDPAVNVTPVKEKVADDSHCVLPFDVNGVVVVPNKLFDASKISTNILSVAAAVHAYNGICNEVNAPELGAT